MDTILILRKKKLLSQPKIDWQVYPPWISTISFFSLMVCVCAGCAYLNGTGEACLGTIVPYKEVLQRAVAGQRDTNRQEG